MAALTSPSTSSFSSVFPSLPACDISSSYDTRAVRFQNECILIPECAKANRRSLIATKTYALPIWPRPRKSSKGDEKEDDGASTWKVPIPTFKKSVSVSTSPRAEPLSPCLVHRSASDVTPKHAPTSPVSPHRTLPSPQKPKETPAETLTVPLRSCCPDCVHTAEQSVKSGDDWEVKFSRGAVRRIKNLPEYHNHKSIHELYSVPKLVLNVDEVDKRRNSDSTDSNDLDAHATPKPTCRLSLRTSPGSTPPAEEDDEDMLFPLPSPLRSPGSSPRDSPKNSPFGTPRASPSGSTSSLSASPCIGTADPSITPKPRAASSPSTSPLIKDTNSVGTSTTQDVDSEVLTNVAPISRPRPISTILPPTNTHSASQRSNGTSASPSSPSLPLPSPNSRRGQNATWSAQTPTRGMGQDELGVLPPATNTSSLTGSPKISRVKTKSPERGSPHKRRSSLSTVTSSVLKVGADVLRGVSMGSAGLRP